MVEWRNSTSKRTFWICLIVGISLLFSAFYLFINDSVTIGVNQFYFQPTIQTPATLFFFSIIFLIISFSSFKHRNKTSDKSEKDNDSNLSRYHKRKKRN